jgi:hypothetical protein
MLTPDFENSSAVKAFRASCAATIRENQPDAPDSVIQVAEDICVHAAVEAASALFRISAQSSSVPLLQQGIMNGGDLAKMMIDDLMNGVRSHAEKTGHPFETVEVTFPAQPAEASA